MHLNSTEYIRNKAELLVKKHHTRNAEELANNMDIIIQYSHFNEQKAAYLVIERNRYIILKDDLPEPMKSIVILHEIGHDQLHRNEASSFKEYSIFDMTGKTMEYEANLFAAHIMLPDDDVIYYMKQGYSVSQIASAMNSDINLVALKAADLTTRGFSLQIPEYEKDFL